MEPAGKGEMKNTADQLLAVQSTIEHRILSIASPFALKCAVELGIPDRIHAYGGEPMPLTALAGSVSVPPAKQPMLRRLMRLLSAQGVFTVQAVGPAGGGGGDDDGGSIGYLLTPFSRLLLVAADEDDSPSMGARLLASLDPDMVNPLHRMSEWLTQEGVTVTVFETAHGGKTFWDVTKERPQVGRLFNEGMARGTRQTVAAAAARCPQVFCGVGTLIDVGGGTGTAAKIIAEEFPEVKCTVLDLPHVVAAAPKSELFDAVAGDMFEYIPPANALLLKNILHNWADEECVKILKQCKKAISASKDKGKVIIMDIVINTLGDSPVKLKWDSYLMLL